MNKTEMIGQKFGRLTVVESAGKLPHGGSNRSAFKCECECGNKKTVLAYKLKTGNTSSCGCIRAAAPDAAEKVKAAKIRDAGRRKIERKQTLEGLGYNGPQGLGDLFNDLKIYIETGVKSEVLEAAFPTTRKD